ncbi:MAG TPA: homoserine O-acetyltransferase [Syntrophales bacterium]|nr:homoserine O-acetyltransferase [Syntrophales bacterium]
MKRKRIFIALVVILFISASVAVAFSYDELVVKKTFELKEYTTVSGKKIAPVRIGYETYGKLSPKKDNVILVCHHFSGTSHAAGKYAASEKLPGYWDTVIGPGKPFDTDKYFIISTDTLCNINTKDPMVTTTGPASINPATGKPYGMSFPVITIRDMVRIQYELIKSLGINKLKCVTGASMGGIQTLEWATSYPDVVEKAIPVIGTPKAYAWTVAWVKMWADAVMLDPKWNNGDYYGKEEPVDGVAYSLKAITLIARSPWWAESAFNRKPADPKKDPAAAMNNKYLIEDYLDKAGAGRAKSADGNSIIYLCKANALHDIGFGYGSYEDALKRIKAKVLTLPSKTDILIYPYNSAEFAEALNKAGGDASLFEIPTFEGHIGGISDIQKAGSTIKAFLEK